MYKENFLDYPSQLYWQRILHERQEQLKNKKLVNNWPFCEGVVDNIGNPNSHPAFYQRISSINSGQWSVFGLYIAIWSVYSGKLVGIF